MKIKSVFSWYNLDMKTNELKDVEPYQTEHGYNFLKFNHDTREQALECLQEFLTEENQWQYAYVRFYLVETFTQAE